MTLHVERKSRTRRWLLAALPPFLFILVVVAGTWPLSIRMDHLHLDSGSSHDVYAFLWDFWWVRHALCEGLSPLYTDAIYAPHGTSLALHTLGLTQSFISLPIQSYADDLSGLVLSVNVCVMLSFLLAGWGMYCLARHLGSWPLGAWCAGVLYAFSNFHIANTVRLHAGSIEWFPWCTLFLLRFISKRRCRDLIPLMITCILLFYASIEYALFVVLLFLVLAVGMWRWQRKFFEGWSWSPLVACFFAIVICFLAVSPYLIALRDSDPMHSIAGERGYREYFSADVFDPLSGNARHPWFGETLMSWQGKLHGGNAGFGLGLSYVSLVLVTMSVMGVVRRRDKDMYPWILVGTVFFILSLGPTLHVMGWNSGVPLPQRLLESIPVVQHARMPMRFMVLFQMVLAILVARQLGSRALKLSSRIVMIALILFETWSAPWALEKPFVPDLYELGVPENSGVLLDWPPGVGDSILVESLHQVVHRQKLIQDIPWCFPRASLNVRTPSLRGGLVELQNAVLKGEIIENAVAMETLWKWNVKWMVIRRRDLSVDAYEGARHFVKALKPLEFVESEEGFRATF